MIKDTLRLNPAPELFLEKCLDDLTFIDNILEKLVQAFVNKHNQQQDGSSNSEIEYISDTEWQFNQLLTEFLLESSPFSANSVSGNSISRPGINIKDTALTQRINTLRSSSNARRKFVEDTNIPAEIAHAEPLVSSAELNSLLGGS